MTLRDDLIAAKALIDTPEKWGRGLESFENGYAYAPKPHIPMCALGACAASVMRNDLWDDVRYVRTVKALEACLPKGFASVVQFNDAPETAHNRIMALFDRAIAALTPEHPNDQH